MTRQPYPPATYVMPGGGWPDGPFRSDAPTHTAPTAGFTAAVCVELARRGWSVAQLADRIGATARWTSRMLRGLTWPDLHAVICIEQVLDIRFPRPTA